MAREKKIRKGWLKLLYILTIIIAGGAGIGILATPELTKWMFGVECPHIVSGLAGSVFLSFALLSVLGLKNPVKFAPILLLQMIYKVIWLLGVVLPLLIAGKVSVEMIPVAMIFSLVIIGDLIAIPFSNIFESISGEARKS